MSGLGVCVHNVCMRVYVPCNLATKNMLYLNFGAMDFLNSTSNGENSRYLV